MAEMRKDNPIDISEDNNRELLNDVERGLYDFKDEERDEDFYKVDEGLTEEIVRQISEEKHDPEWMLEFRLKSLKIYNELKVPDWGPPIDGLDMARIVTYVKSKTEMKASWEELPVISRMRLKSWGSRRRNVSSWPVWVRSTIPSWSITMYVRMWKSRAWSIPIWKVH